MILNGTRLAALLAAAAALTQAPVTAQAAQCEDLVLGAALSATGLRKPLSGREREAHATRGATTISAAKIDSDRRRKATARIARSARDFGTRLILIPRMQCSAQ